MRIGCVTIRVLHRIVGVWLYRFHPNRLVDLFTPIRLNCVVELCLVDFWWYLALFGRSDNGWIAQIGVISWISWNTSMHMRLFTLVYTSLVLWNYSSEVTNLVKFFTHVTLPSLGKTTKCQFTLGKQKTIQKRDN